MASKISALSIMGKKIILGEYDKLPKKTNKRLTAQKLDIPQSALNKLLKSHNEVIACIEPQN